MCFFVVVLKCVHQVAYGEDEKNVNDTAEDMNDVGDSENYDSRSKDQLIFARWHVGEIIGNGAFGAVHKATNVHAKTTVAVKFAIKNTGSVTDEAAILKQLTRLHPNVIRLY